LLKSVDFLRYLAVAATVANYLQHSECYNAKANQAKARGNHAANA
jgi:hypothetical protein